MKPYANISFYGGLVSFVALVVVAVLLAVQFPDGGAEESGWVVVAKALVFLFLLSSAVLWVNGVRILRTNWDQIGEYQKLFWLLAMTCLAGVVGYVLWYRERRQEQ